MRSAATGRASRCAPNSSTIDQAGDDRRDREGQVDQRDQEGLARELELGDRPGGGDAEDEVERHRDRRDEQRQPDGRQRVGVGERGEDRRRSPCAKASAKTGDQRQQQEEREEGEGERRSARQRATRLSVTPPRRACRWCGRRVDDAISHSALRLQAWIRLMTSSISEGDGQHDRGDRGGAGIVEFLQPDDDQQRRDLRHVGQVAGDEDDRAVFADAAREGQREAGQEGRREGRQQDARRWSGSGWRRAWRRLPRPPGRSRPGPAAPCARRRAGR